MDLYKGKGYDTQYFVEVARQKMDKNQTAIITTVDATYKGKIVAAGNDVITVDTKKGIVNVKAEDVLDIA